MKYFETEVIHCVFDDLSILEIYSWKMHLSNSKFSCMFHCTCLLRAVRYRIHSRNNYLFLLMILCASLIFQAKLQPFQVSCVSLGIGWWLETGRLLCPGKSPLSLIALPS
uniref:Uncharacterized protein n=1 Tax=Cercocebus atys TaxID=9531 RepID=A0A2K5KYQ5_CERAT